MTNTTKQYFTREEVIERMVENASWEYHEEEATYMDEVNFEDIIYGDYYIIGIAEARKALEEFGIWKAFEYVQDYLEATGFSVGNEIEFHNAEEVASILWENIANEVISEMLCKYEFIEDFLSDNE